MSSYKPGELWTSSLLAGIAKDGREASGFPKSSSLKAHKVLPRPRVHSIEVKYSSHKSSETKSTNEKSDPSSDLTRPIQSWIPEPPRFKEGTLQQLPLTPPSPSKTESMGNRLELTKVRILGPRPSKSSGLSTPVDQRSPPTPEITPPRRRRDEAELTPPSLPYLIPSGADSFRTAREHFSSDDDPVHTPLPNNLSPPRDLVNIVDLDKHQELELSVDITSNDSIQLTEPTFVDMASGRTQSLIDGTLGHITEEANDSSSSATELGPQHSRRLTPDRLAELVHDSPRGRDSLQSMDDISSTNPYEVQSLRERVQKRRNSPPTASTERFAQQIEWPEEELDAKMRQMDDRRLSEMSAASTIVEAVVVDTGRRRQPVLRRTGKNDSLRTVSSPLRGSYRSSFPSDNPLHQHVRHDNKLTDRDHRASTASDSVAILGQNTAGSQCQSILATAVPARRSSLKSSSKDQCPIGLSATSGPGPGQSSRPATAPNGATGHQSFFTEKGKPMADSVTSSAATKSRRVRSREPPTVIPTRSSSISAPTSRNVSRTTSLTSTSLHVHNAQSDAYRNQLPPSLQLSPDEDHRTESTPQSHGEDISAMRPRSTIATPFSTGSMQSSTPGTLEVKEATAISIYPHNNKSILVVQQIARRDSQQPPETCATIVEAANFTLTAPLTEALPVPSARPRQLVDSPLRHPRSPPQPPTHPPAFTVIPPTPIPLTNVSHPPIPTESPSPSTGPLATLKRALSSRRRNSDSFISPLTRSLSKRNSSVPRRPRLSLDYTSNKLSPFWRPRGFWDDLSDSESDFGNDGVLANQSTKGEADPGYSQTSRRSSLSHRLGSLRLRRRSRSGARNSGRARRYSNDSLRSYAFEQADRGDGKTMPRFGYQVSFIGFKGLREGFERRKVKREEGRREKERARLRRSIGSVFVVPDARVA